jgi:hypothetical protein
VELVRSGLSASQDPEELRIDGQAFRVARAGQVAGLDFPVHAHMLRHSTGFKLATDGQDTRAIQHYLGHKNIQHTVRYTGRKRPIQGVLGRLALHGGWLTYASGPGMALPELNSGQHSGELGGLHSVVRHL